MERGFYTAASGLLTQQKNISMMSNNIANATTVGFKSQTTVGSTFGDHLLSRLNASKGGEGSTVGSSTYMNISETEYTNFAQGNFEATGRNVDMAIQGEGFFVVQNEQGTDYLTRNGQFEIDAEGYLVLPGAGYVLNDSNGKIQLETTEFKVDRAGTIYVGEDEQDKLLLALPSDKDSMDQVAGSIFTSGGGYDQAEENSNVVLQGVVERSNVNLAQEMSSVMAGQNHFQSCSQIIKIFDRINEITANQIGKLV